MPEKRTPFVLVFIRSKGIVPAEVVIDDHPISFLPPASIHVDFEAENVEHEFVYHAIVRSSQPEPKWYLFGRWVGSVAYMYFELAPSEAGDQLLGLGHGDKLTEDILSDPDWKRPRPVLNWIPPKPPDPSRHQGADANSGNAKPRRSRGERPCDTDSEEGSRFITLVAAVSLTALSKGYLSKLCNNGTLRTNGIKGPGRRIDAASLAEFMRLRDHK
jgi:hypothetical protein